jgi:hypothetical protein
VLEGRSGGCGGVGRARGRARPPSQGHWPPAGHGGPPAPLQWPLGGLQLPPYLGARLAALQGPLGVFWGPSGYGGVSKNGRRPSRGAWRAVGGVESQPPWR